MFPNKLRVWDNTLRQYVDSFEVVYSSYGDTRVEVIPNSPKYAHDDFDNKRECDVANGRFVIEPGISQTDSKGNDLYENDLVELRIYNRTGFQGDEYDWEIGIIRWNPAKSQFMWYDVDGLEWSVSSTQSRKVGNIHEDHENKDLLK